MTTILLVDDEPAVLFMMQDALSESGHRIVTARSGEEALPLLGEADVVVTDLSMPGMDGLGLLAEAQRADTELPVILVTAHGSEKIAALAVKRGAYDYLAKPFDVDDLVLSVTRALEARKLRRDAARASAERSAGVSVIAESPAMKRVLAMASKIAKRDLPVLVGGETGTGKEILATLLHAESPRAGRPLVRWNCAAIPLELAEAELFGHAKGAFTGAHTSRKGIFALADGGAVMLDEVAELPLAIQAKLLRVVQFGELAPLGQAQTERVDVRLIACTHRDLEKEVRAGRFREDLYFRLAVVELTLPTLAERTACIVPLARSFAQRAAARFGLPAVTLSESLLASLTLRAWPGNVRELENVVTRAVAFSDGGVIETLEPPREPPPQSPSLGFRARMDAFERSLLAEAMTETGQNQSEAARRLGISRATLIDKLKRFQIID
jgi:DNA-binding NtrC family response regulator